MLAVDEGDGHLELVQAGLQGGVRPCAGGQQVAQRVLRVGGVHWTTDMAAVSLGCSAQESRRGAYWGVKGRVLDSHSQAV